MNNFGASGNNLTKLAHVVCREAGLKIWVLLPQNLWAHFPTTLEFDCKYLRNWSRYRQAENGVINYSLFRRSTKTRNLGQSRMWGRPAP